MPRRELLTSTERLELLAFPEDQGELIRLATLTSDDLAFVRQHRGGHNRLGVAVLMVYLRYPGRVLSADERVVVKTGSKLPGAFKADSGWQALNSQYLATAGDR